MRALLVIDVQNDFMPNGPLAVPEAEEVVPIINKVMPLFKVVVASQDWHPANHKSFASNHINKQPFEVIELHGFKQTLWPDHCIQGSSGAQFHPSLHENHIHAIFRKGMDTNVDSYSCFYDNDHHTPTGLFGYLKNKNIDELFFSGLAADVCVYYSIKDALKDKFKCYLIEDATKALDKSTYQRIKKDLLKKGVQFIHSHLIPAYD